VYITERTEIILVAVTCLRTRKKK